MNMISKPTKDEIREILSDVLDIAVEEITDNAHFTTDLGADSLLALEVLVTVEREYKISVEESELESITSLQNVYDLIVNKMDSLE